MASRRQVHGAQNNRATNVAQCEPLIKDFYVPNPEVANLSAEDVARIRAENNHITVQRLFNDGNTSEAIPSPVWKFDHCFEGYPDLLGELYKFGFKKPTPIQSQSWPILMKGEDLIGIAQTGTGKTLAYLLPALLHTEAQTIPRSERDGPNVLVLVPTHEMVMQIEKKMKKLSFRGMKAVCLYGGGNRPQQKNDINSGVQVAICTPGRLNDFIRGNDFDLASITYVVIDGADQMFDKNFEPQIRDILLNLRPDRQTVMMSSNWPTDIRRLAQSYMNNPIQVCIGSLDITATHNVKQIVKILKENEKNDAVKNFAQNMGDDDKAIIFVATIPGAEMLSRYLNQADIPSAITHGSIDHVKREEAITKIISGEVNILIATNIAPRALNMKGITHVIVYDFPSKIIDYINRVGCTGRGGLKGIAISYVTQVDWQIAKDFIKILEEAKQEVPEELQEMADRFCANKERQENEQHFRGRGGKNRGHRAGGGGWHRGNNGSGDGDGDGTKTNAASVNP